MDWQQYELATEDGRRTTGWLRLPLRKGQRVTLKHLPDVIWTVQYIWSTRLREQPAQDWKVGGLG